MEIETIFQAGITTKEKDAINMLISTCIDASPNLVIAIEKADKLSQKLMPRPLTITIHELPNHMPEFRVSLVTKH